MRSTAASESASASATTSPDPAVVVAEDEAVEEVDDAVSSLESSELPQLVSVRVRATAAVVAGQRSSCLAGEFRGSSMCRRLGSCRRRRPIADCVFPMTPR